MESGQLRRLVVAVSVCALAGSLYALFSNVEVGEPARTCGSVFDSLVDRSGWQEWWALDLDDPDERVRTRLLRTAECPNTVNQRLAVVLGLGTVAAVLGGLGRARWPRLTETDTQQPGQRLVRLGRITSLVGASLAMAGVIGIIALTADADSTLFLYTDRIVVVVIGMVVLVPTVALFGIGRVLVLIGPHIARPEGHDDNGDRGGDERA
ncbi:MAG: hypothetical protein KJN63_09735 [Acidimicrobiia bacterium]|nr:hypothetical protein [Acidimicrobiia bacterium]